MNDDCEDITPSIGTLLNPEEATQKGLRSGWYYLRQSVDHIGPFNDHLSCWHAAIDDRPAAHHGDGWSS